LSCGSPLIDQSHSQINLINQRSYLTYEPNGKITVVANSVAQAKAALKELKLKRRELSLLKKQIMERERRLRADYTHRIRCQGSKVRGRGFLANIVRSLQTSSRDSARADLAQKLLPLENMKRDLEGRRAAVEYLIMQVEQVLLSKSSDTHHF
jgi:hypothetical protein